MTTTKKDPEGVNTKKDQHEKRTGSGQHEKRSGSGQHEKETGSGQHEKGNGNGQHEKRTGSFQHEKRTGSGQHEKGNRKWPVTFYPLTRDLWPFDPTYKKDPLNYSRRPLHQYKVPQFGPCLRKLKNRGGGGSLSGMEYENENLNVFVWSKNQKENKHV